MNKYLKILLGTVIGGGLGFAYYYFIGCTSGSCPLTSNWHITTLYGASVGLAMTFPSKKKKALNNNAENKKNN